MTKNRAGSCGKMEAHSLKRAETGGEDNNLSSLLDMTLPGTLRSLIHRHLCTLDASFVRATTAWGRGSADCSLQGQSSEVTAQMCWDEGPQPDWEVNDVVYLSLVCRGWDRDAHSRLLFVLTHRGTRAERERGSICGDHWTQMMKVLMQMVNKAAVHESDFGFTAYDRPVRLLLTGRMQDAGFTCGLSQHAGKERCSS